MMDAKRALEATDGDADEAAKWLREGIGRCRKARGSRGRGGHRRPRNQRRSRCDRRDPLRDGLRRQVPQLGSLDEELATAVAASGEGAVESRTDDLDKLRTTLQENISIGRVVRFEAGADSVLGSYLHIQNGRGVNAVLVEVRNGTEELAHDLALHIAFARPQYVRREEVPAADVAEEQATVEQIARNEGKPDADSPRSSRVG